MKKIYLLTDYKSYFGSKWNATPYRSGFDQALLTKYFNKYGYDTEYVQIADISFTNQDWHNKLVLYTSSENIGNNYKQYIEDVVYGLELHGAFVLPSYPFLRAHNNKVFMEILRDRYLGSEVSGISSRHFGTFEEIETAVRSNQIIYPCVIKSATGAMSKFVSKAEDPASLLKIAREFSRTPHYLYEARDAVRAMKIKGYQKESRFQNKLVIQSLIPGLQNDWKVLVFGDQYYVLKRHVRPNDFRASGSHINYKSGSEADLPIPMLDYLENIYNKLDIPHLSLDFGYDGTRGYIFEFQSVYFGTSTQYISKNYYQKTGSEWSIIAKEFDQEETYVWGLVKYLESHPALLQ